MEILQNMLQSEDSTFIIYSDGACSGNPGPGGWACILKTPDGRVLEKSGYSPSTTNNRMEMSGALYALLSLPTKANAIVLTDSSYLIRGITQWVFGWMRRDWKNAEGAEVLNKDLWQELLKATKGKKIEWRYIPGHKGFAGNERVDQLAVAESMRQPLYPFSGTLSDYPYAILPLPEKFPIPEMKKNGNSQKKENNFYLSLVNGILERHQTWDQCQRKVKGVSQARFKKVSSEAEAQETLKSWGLDPKAI